MKFPLRLTLDLWRGRLFLAGGGNNDASPIFHLPAACLPALHENGFDHDTGGELHTAADSVRTAAKTKARVLWIGGGEPLDHAEVGRVAFALNARARNVFIHTDGQRLRQRIHEFRPDSRLFLTLDFAGREEIHNRTTGRADAFQRSLEAIRAAKLSGFLVAAHLAVTGETNLCDVGELIEFLDEKDVDGFIVSGGGHAAGLGTEALHETVEDARALIRCAAWESFSRFLDRAYEGAYVAQQTAKLSAPGESAFEEGD